MTLVTPDDICEITRTIWSSVLGLDVEPRQPDAGGAAPEDTLAGCVEIRGAWDGMVSVCCSPALARRVAATMFDVAAAEASMSQTQDAIAEVVNMTGGNLKGLLPEPCALSLPRVAGADHIAAALAHGELVGQVAFDCEGEPFTVRVVAAAPGAA